MENGLGNKKVMAENIWRYMILNGKTRNDLCKDLDIKYTTLTDWLKGNTYPRIDAIEKMANYFGVSKAELVEDPRDTIVLSNISKDDVEHMKKLCLDLVINTSDERSRKLMIALIEKVKQIDDTHYDMLNSYLDLLLESQDAKQQKQQSKKGVVANGTA